MKKIFTVCWLMLWCCTAVRAELWLPLEAYVELCVLIVKCKTEVGEKKVKYKVEEVWKGRYSPDLFHHKTDEGYLHTGTGHGNESPTNGREVIFFFTGGNHPSWTKGKLLHHSTSFVVKDGKVIYASTDLSNRKEYTVEDFKKAILAVMAKQKKVNAEPAEQTTEGGKSDKAATQTKHKAESGKHKKDAGWLVGPMVGQVTDKEATIWAYAGGAAELKIAYRLETENNSEAKVVSMNVPKENNYAGKVTLKELQAKTKYHFQIIFNGKRDEKWSGTFSTAPSKGSRSKFRMTLASCMGQKAPQPGWAAVLPQNPDVLLLLGDNIYSDSTNHKKIWSKHILQRKQAHFSNAIRHIPTFAIWDDHDYGPNNSDGTLPGKENSLRAFKEVWANPYSGTEKTPGAFYDFSWGDVDFYVMDTRYHKANAESKDGEGKFMLGEGQFQWLISKLKGSKGTFKVLATGSTLDSNPRQDDWRPFGWALKRLQQEINSQNIEGILYLSGDIHECLFKTHKGLKYPLHEIISSGINARTIRKNAIAKQHVTLDFDTTLVDPTIHARIISKDGTVSSSKTIKRSELSAK